MRYLSDTAPEAERVLAEAYRAMSPARKWQILEQSQRFARMLHDAGLRQRQPTATPMDFHRSWLRATLGRLADVPTTWEEQRVSSPVDQMRVVREVIAVWDAMGIPYAIGGSLASSVHGTPRYTLDADMTVEPFPGREPEFCRHFGGAYYVSLPAVVEAVHRRSTFNIIDTLAGFKVDVYVRKDRGFEQSVMSRRRILPLGDPPVFDAVVVSPEDIVLLKLEWYRLGGEISDRQWLDVLGVLRVQAPDLDRSYLTQWAEPLGVRDLLDRAVSEADSP